MSRYGNIAAATAIAGFLAGLTPAFAQMTSFHTYRCADGTEFIVGFYPYDSRAYVQIDGGSVMLPKRVALSGTRYSAGGVTLKMTRVGRTTVKRPKRLETACEVI
jgi:membrane-bound inhibitor of C-type lysozyme